MQTKENISLLMADEQLAVTLSAWFSPTEYQINRHVSVVQALNLASQDEIDAMVIDSAFPFVTLQLLAELRSNQEPSPQYRTGVLVLSAKNAPVKNLEYLEAGADDCLTTPFDNQELVARIKALLRRRRLERRNLPRKNVIQYNTFTLETQYHRVIRNGITVDLTPTEYRLFKYLADHAGQVHSIEKLLNAVYDQPDTYEDNNISYTIARIRQKIETKPSQPEIVKNVRGFGYMLVD